jgi:hypothetical protein
MCFARLKLLFLAVIIASIAGCDSSGTDAPDGNLKVVIIRHAEKPVNGDNLSCQGQNRAMQLANVLHQKFNVPDYTYVPALKTDKSTTHSRMFQTVTPFAVKYNLTINSKYGGEDFAEITKSVFKKSGTVLMVWNHSEIPDLAGALGVENPPQWAEADFDSIWIISYVGGKAQLAKEQEGLNPSASCSF